MADIDISQAEAAHRNGKALRRRKSWLFPEAGARQAIILIRLDLDGPPHPNPGNLPAGPGYAWLAPYAGQVMACPHLHLYVEGYGDKWAIPAPVDRYPNAADLFSTFEAFMAHCNITKLPQIEKGLFS